jgi:5-(carboxyamino)imidazole ribonucleotide synthase
VSEQKNGICYKVFGPATAFGVAKALEKKAALYAKKLSSHLNIVGTFAIEFFLDENNKLLVNEIAPRVHNSGHYTQEAFNASQFESHLRAVLGLPFAKLKQTNLFFGMLNILGNSTGPAIKPAEVSDSFLHWYNKTESRVGRKLGHYNVIAEKKEILAKLFENLT